jgi:hypothetical protein
MPDSPLPRRALLPLFASVVALVADPFVDSVDDALESVAVAAPEEAS